MRLAVFAFVLFVVSQGIFAVDLVYEEARFVSDRDATKPNDQAQVIRYLIKRPADDDKFQKNSPVFYGIGGRVTVEDLRAQYTLFDRQFADLDPKGTITPTIVYVEQRYFGKSNTEEKINSYADLADLKLDNVINDHVKLIKKLAGELRTTKFLVFGGGHGGVIASYVTQKFATDDTLKDYTVIGWSSSPPIKYLRRDNTAEGTPLQELNTKVATLLKLPEHGCTDAHITNLNNIYTAIKALRVGNAQLASLKLTPIPVPPAAAATDPNEELKELAIFFRKQIIDLTFNNNPFDVAGKPLGNERNLKKLCTYLNDFTNTAFSTAGLKDTFNNILALFSGNTDPVPWKLKVTTGGVTTWNQKLALNYYQDCTDYQLVYCSTTSNTNPDPFRGSYWDADAACDTIAQYSVVIATECQQLLDVSLNPATAAPSATNYPLTLKTQLITTLNKQSIFGAAPHRFTDADKDSTTTFATFWELWGVDNWEFQSPQSCDTDKAIDVRYLAIKMFGCFSSFIDGYYGSICDNYIFDDRKKDAAGKVIEYDDTPPSLTIDCSAETNVTKLKFPFAHQAVTIHNPGVNVLHSSSSVSPPTTIVVIPSSKSTPLTPATKITPKASTGRNGAGALFPMACILFSSMFLWATTGALL